NLFRIYGDAGLSGRILAACGALSPANRRGINRACSPEKQPDTGCATDSFDGDYFAQADCAASPGETFSTPITTPPYHRPRLPIRRSPGIDGNRESVEPGRCAAARTCARRSRNSVLHG